MRSKEEIKKEMKKYVDEDFSDSPEVRYEQEWWCGYYCALKWVLEDEAD